ncbi:MAG: DUF2227 family putative metal-binding protein [Prochlorococcaceae cyanobacterium]|jgi:uncharacterized metal-binding protein
MASGSVHDRTTCLLSLPYGLLWWPWLGPLGAGGAALAFLVGGLWLSPDLDTRSNATRRWGWLRWLWWPYRRGLSHRSLLSHSPLLGSGLRLLYVAAWLGLLSWLLHPLGTPPPAALLQGAHRLWQEQRPPLLAALLGVEASSWLHLLQDGDPLPRLPRLLRRRRPRRRPSPRRRRRK